MTSRPPGTVRTPQSGGSHQNFGGLVQPAESPSTVFSRTRPPPTMDLASKSGAALSKPFDTCFLVCIYLFMYTVYGVSFVEPWYIADVLSDDLNWEWIMAIPMALVQDYQVPGDRRSFHDPCQIESRTSIGGKSLTTRPEWQAWHSLQFSQHFPVKILYSQLEYNFT